MSLLKASTDFCNRRKNRVSIPSQTIVIHVPLVAPVVTIHTSAYQHSLAHQLLLDGYGQRVVAPKDLIDLANSRGGDDNVTVVLVRAAPPGS